MSNHGIIFIRNQGLLLKQVPEHGTTHIPSAMCISPYSIDKVFSVNVTSFNTSHHFGIYLFYLLVLMTYLINLIFFHLIVLKFLMRSCFAYRYYMAQSLYIALTMENLGILYTRTVQKKIQP